MAEPGPAQREGSEGRAGAWTVAETMGTRSDLLSRLDFDKGSLEWRRLFSELFGTFLLVFVAAGAGMVNARFGGAVPVAAQVVAPGLMVMCIILFMGAVSGAHLNPGVTLAFALRRDFRWQRVPGYIVAQFAGAFLAILLLRAVLGDQGAAGLTLPGPGVGTTTAFVWEILLSLGLVSVILGTASGAQAVGWGAAIGVGGYIALAGLFGAPVSGASMNIARSLGPAIVRGDFTAWWVYLAGPLVGSLAAVIIAYVLRGAGGGTMGRRAGSGTLGELWRPGPLARPVPAHETDLPPATRPSDED
jgi:aquaporin Z